MTLFRFALFAVSLVSLIFLGVPAHAQKIFEQFNKPMPKLTLMAEAKFTDMTQLIDEPASGDPALGYTIRIPKDWSIPKDGGVVNLSAENNILGEIGRFFGPPTLTERSRMQIHALGLDYQMTAQQWLMQHMLLKGYNVQGIEIHGEKSAEALYVLIENAESYVVRSLAILNGKRVIFLEYYIPIDRWHDEKIVQEQVVKSFALKQNVEESVEPLEVYKFLDIAVVQYPVTWKLVAQPIKTIERMKIKMLNLGKSQGEYEVKTKLDGKIEVEMVSAFTSETLEQEIERYRTDLDKSGLAVQDFVEAPEDFVLNPHFDFAETNVYKAADSENKLIDYEFWQTVLSSGDYYYFVSLLTPARDQDYFIWSRNTETYKMILGLMKPQEETMTDDDSGGEILE